MWSRADWKDAFPRLMGKGSHVCVEVRGRTRSSLLEQRCSKNFCICVCSAPINSLLLVDNNVLATGDDTGGIRLWDQRKEGPLMDMRQHEEYIADMALDPAKKLLLTARYSLKAIMCPFPVLNVSLNGSSGQACRPPFSVVGMAALVSSILRDAGLNSSQNLSLET